VGFGGEVGDRVDLFFAQEPIDQGAIGDVALDKPQAIGRFEIGQGGPVARVGQGIEHHHPIARIAIAPMADKVGTNEARTTRDDDAARGTGDRVSHGG